MSKFNGEWTFYNNDSFALDIPAGAPGATFHHYPGAFNIATTFLTGQNVMLEIDYAEVEVQIYNPQNSAGGINTDVFMQIYDLEVTPPAPCGGNCHWGYFGAVPWPQAPVISCVSQVGTSNPSRLIAREPLTLKAIMPGPGGPFIPGPHFVFNNGCGSVHIDYQYRVKGRCWIA